MKCKRRLDIARLVGQGLVWGAFVASTLTVIFFTISYLGMNRGLDAASRHVQQAFGSGDLLIDANQALGSTTIGTHQFNDCLIIQMSLDQRHELGWKGAVSPLLTIYDSVPRFDLPQTPPTLVERARIHDPCPVLYRLVNHEVPSDDLTFYHRYLHGHTILARYLLPILRVDQIRLLYSTLLTALVMAGILFCCYKMACDDRSNYFLLWLIIFMTFARWFGLESFAQSLSHAPADAILLCYLIFLCVGSSTGLSPRTIIISAALFGALTMMFEFLTGGIPLGLAALLGGIPLALHSHRKPGASIPLIVAAAAAFCTAAILPLVFKLVLACIVFGPQVLTDFAGQLGTRMAAASAADVPQGGLLTLATKMIGGLSSLSGRMHLMAGLALLSAVVFGGWGVVKVLRLSSIDSTRSLACWLLLSVSPVALWPLLFWQHTIQHAWFMDRILVWPLAVGFVLFTLGLLERSRALSYSRTLAS
jgi:hypothetical protein